MRSIHPTLYGEVWTNDATKLQHDERLSRQKWNDRTKVRSHVDIYRVERLFLQRDVQQRIKDPMHVTDRFFLGIDYAKKRCVELPFPWSGCVWLLTY